MNRGKLKLLDLKFMLIEYKRTKSLTKAVDIVDWLYDELIKKAFEVKK